MIIIDKVFYIYAITFFISTVIIYIFNKNNILIDKISSSKHKNLQENNKNLPPLCGGIIILICSVLFFKDFFIVTLFGLFFFSNRNFFRY